MPVKLDTHAAERGTMHVDCAFTDEDGVGIAPTALTWTLATRDGNVVNGRTAVAVVTLATAVTITMQGTDLAMIAGQTQERVFLIEWTYNSTLGTGLPQKKQATFVIDDLLMVP